MILKPMGINGAYSLDTVSGTMAAGLSAASPVYSVRWGSATHVAVIQRIQLGMQSYDTGFTAGAGLFEVFIARAFTASDSGGNSVLPATNAAKRRTSMQTTLFTDMRHSSTATLTAGTRTLDTNPIRQQLFGIATATYTVYLATTKVLDVFDKGDHPIVLAKDEGLVIRATVPATGKWKFNVGLDWLEAPVATAALF